MGLSDDCAGCHEDVHQAKLGSDCQQCHTVDEWGELVVEAPFDHGKTDYALAGLHAKVECRECHRSGRNTDPVAFEACTDCHADTHRGQLADRADGDRCEACHDVNGFTPSLYELADHEDSGFPLLGSHRAVPCNACHPKEILGDDGGSVETTRLEYASHDCRSCHEGKMPPGHLADLEEGIACETCHSHGGRELVVGDHDQSKLPLTGRHRDASCASCHPLVNEGAADEHRCYTHLSTTCDACHGDPHVGQFAVDTCESCHTAESWETEKFDHQIASTYPLEGKHLEVACEACHPIDTGADGEMFRRFRPLDTACETCHTASGSVRPPLGLLP